MHHFDSETIFETLSYGELIPAIREAYSKGDQEITVPARSFLKFGNGQGEQDSTLLIMPAWQSGHYIGIKQVTLSPYNGKFDLPTLQGIYLLFDAKNGSPLAMFDAKAITARRTAAKSAVAASFLAQENAETLLMVGTGSLSAELIRAHCTVRNIKKILIWEHTLGKGQTLIDLLPDLSQTFEVVNNLKDGVQQADIISVATMSTEPLIKGKWLKPGQHLDMVGAYRTDMREGDDEALKRSQLYVDHDDAWHETGDLVIPIEKGIITKYDAVATLLELSSGKKSGRKNNEEITYFKSTGHAMEDLTAALLVYQKSKPHTS